MRLVVVFVLVLASACVTPSDDPNGATFLGVVAAASPEATEAGRRILESGGNAVDAAIAVSFALGVSEPAMSGLGGQTQILLFSAENGGVAINGTSFAPRATPPDADKADLVGRRATTVPTTLRVLDYAYRNYGSGNVSWGELLEPAIEYADNGVALGPFRRLVYARHARQLEEDEATGSLFRTRGDERFRQPILAETLRRIATDGADDFYRGAIAREIAQDMARHGGWVQYEDLAELPDPVELDPLSTSYRGYQVLTLPPPGGGWVVLSMLEMLETADPASLAVDSSQRAAALARVLHRGHRERHQHPVEDLDNYDDDIQNRLSETAVRRMLDDDHGETTHFSIVDGNGMAVSVTASINAYYGARVAHPSLGFLYNDYMHEFEIGQPTHPFDLRPGAMPYSSMSPTVLVRDGEARLVLGSPGSARIISAITQVIQLWVDGGLEIEDAVAYPRFHVQPDRALFTEDPERFRREVEALVHSGFVPRDPPMELANERGNPFFGGVHAVAFEDGAWVGAADPRRDGATFAAWGASAEITR